MDKYDEEIAYLTKNPEEIFRNWSAPSALFQFAGNDICGCLTQIRGPFELEAQTVELTVEIRADSRIPKIPCRIAVADLPVFAEWQRRLDKELKRD